MNDQTEDILIKLSGDYSIYEIEDKFHEIDMSWMNSSVEKITFSLDDVDNFDVTFFQLLMMMKISAISVEKKIIFDVSKKEIIDTAESLLIDGYLEIKQPETAEQ
ncbi:MAG: hypothetical protein D6B27_11530 [Gammaproteobacteria bacterium]|nr:MAG: hypothetical protein D6B27_11530 [Gammaproteobacteria bacterium]